MKILIVIFSILLSSIFAIGQESTSLKETQQYNPPLFQLSAGLVASSVDLSRYVNYELIRGLHASIITHVKGSFFISTEYSGFPVHTAQVAWDDIHTHKIDVNAHFSFAMTRSNAHIYALLGIDRHEWSGRFTGVTNLDQLATGLKQGAYAQVKRWGVNAGVGFTQPLYENISIIGDFRFNLSTPNGEIHLHPQTGGSKNEFGILDIMTTFGITFDIPHLPRSKKEKAFGIGKKMYKWTESGGK